MLQEGRTMSTITRGLENINTATFPPLVLLLSFVLQAASNRTFERSSNNHLYYTPKVFYPIYIVI